LKFAGVPEGWRREVLVPSRKGPVTFIPGGCESKTRRQKLSRSERRRKNELLSAFIRGLVDSAWNGERPTMGKQNKDYLAETASTGHELQFQEWVKDRKRVRRPYKGVDAFYKRPSNGNLYGFIDQLREGRRLRPVPCTHGGSVVRRWLSEGVPSEAPRAGVGSVSIRERVWVPVGEQEEDVVSWRDCAPWETLYGGGTYEQFLLGVCSESTPPKCVAVSV